MFIPFLVCENSKCEHHKIQAQEGKNAKNGKGKKKWQTADYEGTNPI